MLNPVRREMLSAMRQDLAVFLRIMSDLSVPSEHRFRCWERVNNLTVLLANHNGRIVNYL